MNRKNTEQFSQEMILEMVSDFIAGTINLEAMNIYLDDQAFAQLIEEFKTCFKEKAGELLEYKDSLLLTIGPYVNTDNNGIYSNDMLAILNIIEEKMQMTFVFYYGAMVLFNKHEFFVNWLPE